MAREGKAEVEVRNLITRHLVPNETLREYTWGAKDSSSMAYFFFGHIGAALARRDQPGFIMGLTDKRLILIEVKGKLPTGAVYGISIGDIRGMSYKRGPYSGTLNIHLSADTLALNFDSKPWYPRAQSMSKIMPLQK